MSSMNSRMHRVEGKCEEIDTHTVPLGSRRFIAWTVSLCSGRGTRYEKYSSQCRTVVGVVGGCAAQ